MCIRDSELPAPTELQETSSATIEFGELPATESGDEPPEVARGEDEPAIEISEAADFSFDLDIGEAVDESAVEESIPVVEFSEDELATPADAACAEQAPDSPAEEAGAAAFAGIPVIEVVEAVENDASLAPAPLEPASQTEFVDQAVQNEPSSNVELVSENVVQQVGAEEEPTILSLIHI